jgi:hypothetical protein
MAVAIALGLSGPMSRVFGSSSQLQRSEVGAVRQQLARQSFAVVPLFPARIPRKIACCQAELSVTGAKFDVAFHDRDYELLVNFGREGSGYLSKLKRMVKAQGHRLRHRRVGARRTIFAKSDVAFFYAWRVDGFTYYAISHYTGGVKLRDLRVMVATAVRVKGERRLLESGRQGPAEASVVDPHLPVRVAQ